jgi:hypothetical protein
MNNKRGLSTIVTTLIIVALSLVAVGIVWVVVNNIVTKQTANIDYKAKCLDLEVRATSANCTIVGTNYACDVTLKRTLGEEAIGGVRLVFTDGTNSLKQYDTAENLVTSKAYTAIDTAQIVKPTVVTAAVYFKDTENVKQVCAGSTTFNIE